MEGWMAWARARVFARFRAILNIFMYTRRMTIKGNQKAPNVENTVYPRSWLMMHM